MLNIGVIGCQYGRGFGAKRASTRGEGCKIYSDGKDLINDANVEVVFIVSPGFAHKKSLLEAIKLGKHLIQLGFMRKAIVKSKRRLNPANTAHR